MDQRVRRGQTRIVDESLIKEYRVGPKTETFPPPEGKKPDAVYENPTNEETAALYRLNGGEIYMMYRRRARVLTFADYNPLHIDPTPGKKMGKPSI